MSRWSFQTFTHSRFKMAGPVCSVLLWICPCDILAQAHIEIERLGNEIRLTWTGGFLQTAPQVRGPWSLVAGAISPHRMALLQGAFFRVQQTYPLTVSKTGTGSGTIRSTQEGIACGLDCSEALLSGRTVTLQAVADPGSIFAGWGGACQGTGDCQVTMDGPKSVTATFTRAPSGNPVLNGGFELGPAVAWQQQPGQLIYSGAELGVTPHSGQYLARLGFDRDARRLARIGQQITLPNSTPLFLNFAVWLYSEELCDVPYYDSIALYIAGQTVVKDDRVCRGSDSGGWLRYSVDVGPAAGQTVAIVFEISSADALTSIMLLDDISISDQSWQ